MTGRRVTIIGGGASGLMAAYTAASCGADVHVIEHKNRCAEKLRLTGNGKCNITNLDFTPRCYYRDDDSEITRYFDRFGPRDTIDFFRGLGIGVTDRFGYVYPDGKDADGIAEALLNACRDLRVCFHTGETADDIRKKEYGSVILATGGRSYRKTGSDGSGYRFLEKLEIPYTWVLPALCALYSDDSFCSEYAGKRLIAEAAAIVDGEELFSDLGEVQILNGAVSGIPVLNISRFISRGLHEEKRCFVRFHFDHIDPDALPGFLKERKLCRDLPPVTIEIRKTAGFERAQVCTGGIPFSAVDDQLQLRNADGIYVCGEICDIDGRCGGYNLQWAWTSGYIAGKSAAGAYS